MHNRSIGGLGTEVAARKKTQALFFTWALMGLWHGASWTFVVWGLFHACFIFFYRLCMNYFTRFSNIVRNIIGRLLTLPIVMPGWIPFRAQSLADTFSMWATLFSPAQYTWSGMRENTYLFTAILLIGIVVSFLVSTRLLPVMSKSPILLLLGESIFFTIVIALVFIYLRPVNQFIYFQF